MHIMLMCMLAHVHLLGAHVAAQVSVHRRYVSCIDTFSGYSSHVTCPYIFAQDCRLCSTGSTTSTCCIPTYAHLRMLMRFDMLQALIWHT